MLASLILALLPFVFGLSAANGLPEAARPVLGAPLNHRQGHSPTARASGQEYSANLPSNAQLTGDELYQAQTNLWEAFIWPNNAKQAQEINSSTMVPNVKGRIDITRTFTGAELNTEYLFGLFANLATNPDTVSLLGVPVAYTIEKAASTFNSISASTKFTFNFTSLGNVQVPIIIETWNNFDNNGKLLAYDATFKWWDWTVDYLFTIAQKVFNQPDRASTQTAVAKALAGSICKTASTYCNVSLTGYENADDCNTFLLNDVRFGEPYELGRNTLLCRMVHQSMVPLRPDVHCPHIGMTGGGYCNDDVDYLQTVESTYFPLGSFNSFIGHGAKHKRHGAAPPV